MARATSSLPVPDSPTTSTVDMRRRHARHHLVDVEHRRRRARRCSRCAVASSPPRARAARGSPRASRVRSSARRTVSVSSLDVEGLGDVVVGALLDRRHRAGDVAERGDEDDRRLRRALLERGQHVHAAGAVAQPHVGDDEVVVALAGARDRLVARRPAPRRSCPSRRRISSSSSRATASSSHDQDRGVIDALMRALCASTRRAAGVTVKVEPRPGALSTVMRPPSAVASSRQMARPRPVPLPRPLVV